MRVGLVLAVLLVGCGGEQAGPTEPVGEEPSVASAGTVSVANRTAYAIEVAYLNETDAQAPRIVRTRVPPGERVEVSDAVLPAGLEVEFDLVLIPPTGEGIRVRRKMQVAIDGDLVLGVRLIDESDPFSVEIAIET
jgi:hypothetical protein